MVEAKDRGGRFGRWRRSQKGWRISTLDAVIVIIIVAPINIGDLNTIFIPIRLCDIFVESVIVIVSIARVGPVVADTGAIAPRGLGEPAEAVAPAAEAPLSASAQRLEQHGAAGRVVKSAKGQFKGFVGDGLAQAVDMELMRR